MAFDLKSLFQSTPSAWRETASRPTYPHTRIHFNPLPPHGGRRTIALTSDIPDISISIHSLRMEGDQRRHIQCWGRNPFQSTPSAWRETSTVVLPAPRSAISIHSLRMEGDRAALDALQKEQISIHSLRMEGDDMQWYLVRIHRHFNPLPPHGGRLYSLRDINKENSFQSTPSAWRETRLTCPVTV